MIDDRYAEARERAEELADQAPPMTDVEVDEVRVLIGPAPPRRAEEAA